MDLGSPQEWTQGAGAIKAGLDALRSAWGLIKDIRGSGKSTTESDAVVEEALKQAEVAAKVAEAHVAKALGYELCHCQFPPTAMLTVGFSDVGLKDGASRPIHECPKCGNITSGPWQYTRLAPPRS